MCCCLSVGASKPSPAPAKSGLTLDPVPEDGKETEKFGKVCVYVCMYVCMDVCMSLGGGVIMTK